MSAGPREQTTEPLRDKIAQVLSEHVLFEYDWGVDGDCICGFRTPKSYDFAAHSEHVADAVVEALGLREERVDSYDFGSSVRWVSGWSVVGGEPT
jgi:ribosomal protein S12 methylthiotransferase accessory factor YcaO